MTKTYSDGTNLTMHGVRDDHGAIAIDENGIVGWAAGNNPREARRKALTDAEQNDGATVHVSAADLYHSFSRLYARRAAREDAS